MPNTAYEEKWWIGGGSGCPACRTRYCEIGHSAETGRQVWPPWSLGQDQRQNDMTVNTTPSTI